MGANKSKQDYDEVWIIDSERDAVCMVSLMYTISSLQLFNNKKKIFVACSYDPSTIHTLIDQYNLEIVRVEQNSDCFNMFCALNKKSCELKYYGNNIKHNTIESCYTNIDSDDIMFTSIKESDCTVLLVASGDVVLVPELTLRKNELCRSGAYYETNKPTIYYSLSGTLIMKRELDLMLKKFIDSKQPISHTQIRRYFINICTRVPLNRVIKNFGTFRNRVTERTLRDEQLLSEKFTSVV